MAKYKIVSVDSSEIIPGENNEIELLEKKVNKLIEDGWSCTGGVSYVSMTSRHRYHQAMIKNTHDNTKQNQELEKQVKLNSERVGREANPQITVRGALVKYVWNHLDVKKVAADKGMHFIGVPAKIVQMVMTEAMKDHPMSEADKKSAAHWNAVQKTAMKLLADNLQKYAGMVKK